MLAHLIVRNARNTEQTKFWTADSSFQTPGSYLVFKLSLWGQFSHKPGMLRIEWLIPLKRAHSELLDGPACQKGFTSPLTTLSIKIIDDNPHLSSRWLVTFSVVWQTRSLYSKCFHSQVGNVHIWWQYHHEYDDIKNEYDDDINEYDDVINEYEVGNVRIWRWYHKCRWWC